ncbi:MAG TPA: shikimate kinase [Candidatus Acidoferrales bacterium]|jgi:shikimate kinase|nr:shikimate kinase [Candidatus Acidoferrales bacterium]
MARAHPTRRVFLVGFMGAGKTSVGQALASRLGWEFCDLDRLIERREGNSVAEIFAAHGEAGFRKAEAQALMDLLQDSSRAHDLVVALGGGTFAQPGNREALEEAGAVTVLLDAPLDELRRRCSADETVRPLALNHNRFAALYEERQPAYLLATYRVSTMNKTVEDVTAAIDQILLSGVAEAKQ